MNEVDVLIVGAGLSGIDAAVHLQKHCPGTRFVLLEGRQEIAGTWSLFRYPGVRSDSDMHTLGFGFKPWLEENAIASGEQVRSYLHDTVREHGLTPHIRLQHRVRAARWHSDAARWQVDVQVGDAPTLHTWQARFLFFCGGYYRYEQGHAPQWPGMERFAGRVVQPQFWPQGLAVKGQRVLLIGSGATAVTLAPALAGLGAQVQMLQRSPTWLLNRPTPGRMERGLRKLLGPQRLAPVLRQRNAFLAWWLARAAQRRPERVGRWLLKQLPPLLPPGYDIATHFTPRYPPWQQRLCLVPDADFFKAICAGQVEMVTDEIAQFTAQGVQLNSGRELRADLVVSATGLQLQPMGGMVLEVDGKPLRSGELVNYKGAMYKDVPNLFATFGYTRASWTLKADLTSLYACRVLQHMAATGAQVCVPRSPKPVALKPWADMTSGYFERARDELPRQGLEPPWALTNDWYADRRVLQRAPVADGLLQFSA